MNKLQPYTTYKPSGIAWIGDIPAHWEVSKGKYVFRNRKELNADLKESNRLSLTLNGVINKSINDNDGLNPNDFATYQKFNKHDLVFKLIDLENINTSRVGLVHENGIMSSAYIRLTANINSNPKYFYYLFYNWYKQNIFNFLGSGVRATMTSKDLLDLSVPIFQENEQIAIANFLDYKTAKIDRFIRKKKQLIKLLNEQKAAIINDAVTKGLNPNAKTKPSGIEWLGDIPEHWEVTTINYAVKLIGDIDHYMPQTINIGVPYIVTGNLKEFVSLIDFESCKKVSQEDYSNLSRKIKTEKGDVILARYATIGTASYVDVDLDFLVSYSCVTIKPNTLKLLGMYLFCYFKTNFFTVEISNQIKSNTQGNVGIQDLKKVKIILPPLSEQAAIVAHIEKETAIINNAIATIEKEIALVQEYRTAIIAEAVTGKIDVRGYELPTLSEAEADELDFMPDSDDTAAEDELDDDNE